MPTHPHHVWTVDCKGWFSLGNGQRCDPLPVCDRFSHYVLAVRAQPDQQFGHTLYTFRALMRQAGLPEIIRVDHGSPFVSVGLGRRSRLSVWWIEQGIEVEFTGPAALQKNGSHERMHRDLKAEATQPPSAHLAAQQRRFERWRYTYNHERPHELLEQQRPADVYQPSARRLNEHDKPLVYPPDCEVKVVSTSGQLAQEGRNHHLGDAFVGKRVGLRRTADGQTEVYFANVHLGNLRYDAERGRFAPSAYVGRGPYWNNATREFWFTIHGSFLQMSSSNSSLSGPTSPRIVPVEFVSSPPAPNENPCNIHCPSAARGASAPFPSAPQVAGLRLAQQRDPGPAGADCQPSQTSRWRCRRTLTVCRDE